MTRTKHIAIISARALAAQGLKQLMAEYFELFDCRIFASADELTAQQSEQFDLYFAEATDALLSADFFMPRRSKTVILLHERPSLNRHASSPTAATPSSQPGGYLTLCTHADLSTIVDSLQAILARIDATTDASRRPDELTSREVEVLRLITRGKINKEIADELCISLNTVLTHRKNITSKLGIKTVSGLTFYAMMNGLVD